MNRDESNARANIRPWTYAEKLGTPMWFRRRFEVISRDNHTCQKCKWRERKGWKQICDPSHLEVHHLYYKSNLQPWEYSDDALITLCDRCHGWETEKQTIFYREGEMRTSEEEFFQYCLGQLARKHGWR